MRNTASKPTSHRFPSLEPLPQVSGSKAQHLTSPVFKHFSSCVLFWRSTEVTQKTFTEKKKKDNSQLLCIERAGSLNKQKTKGDHVQQDKQHTLTFPRVRQSQWLHKDICCIHLQYLKKALLSLRCIYTLIGFFLASK